MSVIVPVWLVLPPCEARNLGVFDLCEFDLLKRGCANSVCGGLELAELLRGTLRISATNPIGFEYRKRAEYCFESTVSEKRTH